MKNPLIFVTCKNLFFADNKKARFYDITKIIICKIENNPYLCHFKVQLIATLKLIFATLKGTIKWL